MPDTRPPVVCASPSAADRRVRRTREVLRRALLALLVERGWDDIDVQSLCERADIGRSTFYQHYPNREALLCGSLGDLRDQLRAQAPVGSAGAEQLAFVAGLVAHVHEQRAVFCALLGRRSGRFVQDRFQDLLVELTLQEVRPPPPLAHMLAGALFQLLIWWLGEHQPQSPREIEMLFQGISAPVLAAARV